MGKIKIKCDTCNKEFEKYGWTNKDKMSPDFLKINKKEVKDVR